MKDKEASDILDFFEIALASFHIGSHFAKERKHFKLQLEILSKDVIRNFHLGTPKFSYSKCIIFANAVSVFSARVNSYRVNKDDIKKFEEVAKPFMKSKKMTIIIGMIVGIVLGIIAGIVIGFTSGNIVGAAVGIGIGGATGSAFGASSAAFFANKNDSLIHIINEARALKNKRRVRFD